MHFKRFYLVFELEIVSLFSNSTGIDVLFYLNTIQIRICIWFCCLSFLLCYYYAGTNHFTSLHTTSDVKIYGKKKKQNILNKLMFACKSFKIVWETKICRSIDDKCWMVFKSCRFNLFKCSYSFRGGWMVAIKLIFSRRNCIINMW